MPELIGIARLAAESLCIEAKRRVEYFELETRRFITRCDSPRVPFRWTINPYRGCEFGCKYCYARYAHEFMELRDPLQFERKIFAKHFDAAAFRDELKKMPRGEVIALGTATDPYQPAERRYRVTRAILDVFASCTGFRLGITTKSDLIARDIDLLQEIARRHYAEHPHDGDDARSRHGSADRADGAAAGLTAERGPKADFRGAACQRVLFAGDADD